MSTDDTSAATTAGKDGCLCTDESTTLASITKRSCTTADGDDNGVLLSAEGPCVNYMYGSLNCLRHDLNVDPACNATSPEGGESTIPEYCQHRWCYVDAKSCGKDSLERVFRSTYFPAHMGVDLFYSYTTCNSSDAHWNPHKYVAELGSIKAAIPSYTLPFIYKRSPADDDILSEIGEEYYEDSVPFEGVHIEFVRSLQSVADGEFNVTYTHGTRANKLIHKTSAYTAAVQDIEDGLVDLAVGPFWITGERLKMSAFTMPIVYDRTILVIPKPGTQGSLSAQTKKVLAPFETGVWVLLLLIIAFTGLLSVWFSGKRFYQKKRSNRPDKSKYARLALDEFLRKGIFFCSAGVEQDEGASLSHKLLMFGFGFFILIVVSAYVANLAAFLTRSMPKYIGTMEEVVDAGLQVCAHPALREEYKIAWPTANFVFNESGAEDFYGLIEDYDNGRCDVIAIGSVETLADMDMLNMFCTRDLVMTDSLVLENPIAYPIRADLGEQFSYWIYEAEKYHGISIQASQKEYDTEHHRQPKCTVQLSQLGLDSINKYAQISVANRKWFVHEYLNPYLLLSSALTKTYSV